VIAGHRAYDLRKTSGLWIGGFFVRVCQRKVEPGFLEKTKEKRRIESLSGSISQYTTLRFYVRFTPPLASQKG
jgi:hypothetical protein